MADFYERGTNQIGNNLSRMPISDQSSINIIAQHYYGPYGPRTMGNYTTTIRDQINNGNMDKVVRIPMDNIEARPNIHNWLEVKMSFAFVNHNGVM